MESACSSNARGGTDAEAERGTGSVSGGGVGEEEEKEREDARHCAWRCLWWG